MEIEVTASRKNVLFSILFGFIALFLVLLYRSLAFFDYSIGSLLFRELSALHSVLYSSFFLKAVVVDAVFISIAVYFSTRFSNFYTALASFVFTYRYALAVLILLLLVLCNVSGSSIGMWVNSLPDSVNDGLLFGVPRECRTDEWALFTGMTFAQFNDSTGLLPYIGSVLRGCNTDMFILYGQPVLDLSMIFRPFQIGYLVFGLSRGLSFYWYSRLIFLGLTSFDLGLLLFENKKHNAVFFALLVAFSPVVSWWFSINNFVEMLVSFNILILGFNYFFSHAFSTKKVLCTILISQFAGCFILSMYPAWMIPLLYLLAAILIGLFIKNKSSYVFNSRSNIVLITMAVVATALLLIRVIIMSENAISAELSTVYPGSRISTGGGQFLTAFRYPISTLLPFLPSNFNSGLSTGLPDNLTTFYDFFPLGILLFLFNSSARKDPLCRTIFVYVFILSIYCFIGLPYTLAQITLLGKSIPERALVVLSLANLILVFRCVTLIDVKRTSNLLIIAFVFLTSFGVTYLVEENVLSFAVALFVALFSLAALLVFVINSSGIQFAIIIILCAFIGAFVNPVQQGIACVQDNSLVSYMRSLSNDNPDSRWIASVGWKSNITLFAGVPNLSSTNIYPNYDLWKTLDPYGEKSDVWNRYAHIHVDLTTEKSSFELVQVDVVDIHLNLETLKQLNVDFILNEGPLSDSYQTESCHFRYRKKFGDYYIYQLY